MADTFALATQLSGKKAADEGGGDGDEGSPLVKAIGAVFGLFTGLATLIYIGGGGIMALRLQEKALPSPVAVSAGLPKEVLISVGLTGIVLPMVLVAAGYFVYRLARGQVEMPFFPGTRPGNPQGPGDPHPQLALACWSIVGGLLLCLPGWLWAFFQSDVSFAAGYVLAAVIISSVVVFGALRAREALGTAADKSTFNGVRMVAIFAALWAVTSLPGWIFLGSAVKFQQVAVCGESGAYPTGFLVGSTTDNVYVGEDTDNESPPLLVIPAGKVTETVVGPPDEFTCPAPVASPAGG